MRLANQCGELRAKDRQQDECAADQRHQLRPLDGGGKHDDEAVSAERAAPHPAAYGVHPPLACAMGGKSFPSPAAGVNCDGEADKSLQWSDLSSERAEQRRGAGQVSRDSAMGGVSLGTIWPPTPNPAKPKANKPFHRQRGRL